MDQNQIAVGPPPVEYEHRRLTREELDAILGRDTYMRTPSGTLERVSLRGGSNPGYHDYHGLWQGLPPVVYLRVRKADYSDVDLEVGTEGDNIAQGRQNAALKASRRDIRDRLADAAGQPFKFYDDAVLIAVDALKERRELRERVAALAAELKEARSATCATQKTVEDAHECIARVSEVNEKQNIVLQNARGLNDILRQELASMQARAEVAEVTVSAALARLTDLLTCVMDVGDEPPLDLHNAVSSVVSWVKNLQAQKDTLRAQLDSAQARLKQETQDRQDAEARAGQRARRVAELEEQVARGTVVYGWKESDAVGVQFSHVFVTNQTTPAKFMELAQAFFQRSSVWTADEAWVSKRLVDLAHVPPGKFVPEDVARRMCEMAFSAAAKSPAQRAREENTAGLLDAWLHDLKDGLEWYGCTGGPAFGVSHADPGAGGRHWKLRTLHSRYEVSPQLPVPREVYVRFTRDDRRRRVTVVREFHREKETLGYRDGAQFIPFDICIVDEVIPEGYREVDLAELSVGEQVAVRDDRGELTLVTVVAGRSTSDTRHMCLGYNHPTEDGGTKFTPFTDETYVRDRGAK